MTWFLTKSCHLPICFCFLRDIIFFYQLWSSKKEKKIGDNFTSKITSHTLWQTTRTGLLVPLYGTSLFTIGIFNLTAFFLFGIKESSYVLLASGICFWLGTIFVRSTFSEKTSNHYKKGRKEVLTSVHTLGWLIYNFSSFLLT